VVLSSVDAVQADVSADIKAKLIKSLPNNQSNTSNLAMQVTACHLSVSLFVLIHVYKTNLSKGLEKEMNSFSDVIKYPTVKDRF
jgi:hypothetical protein